MNDKKYLIIILGITVLLFGGFIAFASANKNTQPTVLGQANLIEANPSFYELGQVPLNGGVVTKEYEIKNTHSEEIILKKIATSCMCTRAKVVSEGQETEFFGMEHPGDRNKTISFLLAAGESAKVLVEFDPAAHGPQGVGPFDREVWLTFTDPVGVKSLKFSGTVVN